MAQLARRPRLARVRRHGPLEGRSAGARSGRPRAASRPSWSRSTLRQQGYPLRQRHAHDVVRPGRGPRQAALPPPRRQRLDRRADRLVPCGPRSAPPRRSRSSRSPAAAATTTRARGCAPTSTAPTSCSAARRSEFKRAGEDYLAFARGELGPRVAVQRLERSESDIRATRDELAVLHPPREAVALHSKLQRVYDMNLELAHETRCSPTYERERRPARWRRSTATTAASERRCAAPTGAGAAGARAGALRRSPARRAAQARRARAAVRDARAARRPARRGSKRRARSRTGCAARSRRRTRSASRACCKRFRSAASERRPAARARAPRPEPVRTPLQPAQRRLRRCLP